MRGFLPLCLVVLLSGCSRGKSTDDWVTQLQAPEGSQRLHAIKALEERQTEAGTVVPALIVSLKDRDAFVRRDAATALGRLGPAAKEAGSALRPLLRDSHTSVRKAAAKAMRKIDPELAAASKVP